GAEAVVVRAQVPAMDALVSRVVAAGIAVRELAPVVSPLEAAFLALTEQQEPDDEPAPRAARRGPHAQDADAPEARR
ncbi:MAG TPA: hypothetical protein VHF26_15230, partial [Trebonia sp.]|nr:hypothetical protein [Trebonia sp.]